MRKLAVVGLGLLSLGSAVLSGCYDNSQRVPDGYPMPIEGEINTYFDSVNHPGIDIDSGDRFRQPVFAVDTGEITFMGGDSCCSYGIYIEIKHDNGMETVYGHLDEFKEGFGEGDRVKKCDQIGYAGSTGYSTGPH